VAAGAAQSLEKGQDLCPTQSCATCSVAALAVSGDHALSAALRPINAAASGPIVRIVVLNRPMC